MRNRPNPEATGAGHSVADLVAASRSGDDAAFAELVRRFHDMALACAHSRLGDLELARDATQEAFALAHRLQGQLREDAAFPGWLRRLVGTQADRIARKRVPLPVAQIGERLPASMDESGATPLAALERRVQHERVRRALENLPPPQRIVVSLFYLAEESVAEIATFLELTEAAVKKRLHDARKRMRERGDSLGAEMEDSPPSAVAPAVAREVAFFIALREDDCDKVEALLARDPQLVHAEERWSVEEALQHDWPIPTGATPLIRAAERDHPAMIDLLLERGAPLDGACGCAGGESPLWAAVVTGRRAAVERLIERGAQVDRPAFRGQTPLHVAAGRGDLDVIALLLKGGASCERRDADGRLPADWAHIKGHSDALRCLSARGSASGAPVPSTDGPAATGAEAMSFWDTGIKAIDLFAPIGLGTLMRVHGGSGVGRNILLAELSHRWHAGSRGPVLWALQQRETWEQADLDQLRAETGIGGDVEIFAASSDETPPAGRWLAAQVLRRVLAAESEGAAPLLVWFERAGARSDLDALSPQLKGRATTLVVTPVDEGQAPAPPVLEAPFDGAIVLDPALAAIAHFPCVDPIASGLRGARPSGAAPRGEALRSQARKLLAQWRQAAPDARPETLAKRPDLDVGELGRAIRLQSYLTQPFHTTEPFGGRPGVSVAPETSHADIAAILEGAWDGHPPSRLFFRGALEADGPA